MTRSFFILARYDDPNQRGEGGIEKISSALELERCECKKVPLSGAGDTRVFRLARLNNYTAGIFSSSSSTGDLSEELKDSLGGAKIGKV